LKLYLDGVLKWEADPDRKNYGNLKYPPFIVEIVDLPLNPWGDLKIEGYIGGKLVKTLVLSGRGVDADLKVEPDDTELIADGRDATRVVLRVTDEHGNIRPFATGSIALRVTGPADIIGENPFALAGGGGAVWLRAKESPGIVRLEATHPYLGTRRVEVRVKAGEAEAI
jgi:beta-galactosidase